MNSPISYNQYTPGPWSSKYDDLYHHYFIDAAEHTVAMIYSPKPDSEREGDARLIAAAPDLLAALEEAKKYCPVFVQNRIHTAIAKAKGETL